MGTHSSWTRRDFFRRSGVAAAAVGAPVLLSSCVSKVDNDGGSGLLDEIRDRGYIKVGFSGEVPYAYQDSKTKRLTGEAPEVARVVLAKMGIKEMRGTQVAFDALIPSLVKGDFDMIAAGMFITPERCQKILFSAPDYVASTALLVPKGNPKGLTNYQTVDKAGAKVGVLSGAVEGEDAAKSGISKSKIKLLKDKNTMWQELEAKKVDALALTTVSLKELLGQHKGAPFEVPAPFFPVINGKPQIAGGGFGFHKNAEELRDAFNTRLNELKQADGVFPLIGPFGFAKADAEGAKNQTAASLGCTS